MRRSPLPLAALALAACSAALPACTGGRSAVAPDHRREPGIVEPQTGMELVLILGGRMEEGETFDAGQENRVRLPEAELPDYYMGRFEVTQAQWTAVMGLNPSRVRGDRRPVEQVSWDEAAEFARRLSALSGRPFRLPTEAEWELAARRGQGPSRSSGAPETEARALARYAGDSERLIRDVGQHRADALGLFDLGGNVSEWCSDRYSPRPGEVGGEAPDDGYRVLRGGAWGEGREGVDASYRMGFHRSWVGRTVGFRVVSPATP